MSEIHPENYSHLRNLMCECIAVHLPDDKAYLAEARLHSLAREYTQGDINALIEKACSDTGDELRCQLVEAMAINETYFFRDPIFNESFIDHMLPNLMKRRRSDKTLRIWSAACSTGQEPYSIALLLEEHFPELKDWDVQIIASDFSRQSLSKAQSGRYGLTEMNRGLPALLMAKHFEQIDLEWQVKPVIREKVEFQRINLIHDWPEALPQFDIVLLRNVLLYFSMADRMKVLHKVRSQCRDDGYLLLGAAENLEIASGFTPVQAGKCGRFYQPG
ncbi:protein-glutamate O-methyltransferase CheR [Alcanivorax sp. DP30]|uniref:CheR family methyltransferase n=1 Tax=Alcanivorax sp. DP30 TaxID=2606217 RepID=UPI00136C721D|nr:protein-glutamate O-methyltransferase CheR [Alcanivorax sp. DP30]MZR61399.1 protein-glutamate O-methyltransferase CheR [Alcanivorax sp. DP30]